MENNKEPKKNVEIDLNTMHLKVYNKIAAWYNQKGTNEEKGKDLKFMSHEIIQDILNDVFEQLGLNTSTKVLPGNQENKKGFFGKLKNVFK